MYCILVSGVPASGKTTMAAFLSSRLNLPMISKDHIKELLYDTVGFEGRAQKVKLGEAAMTILCDFAQSCLMHGQSVILENNFERASRGELRAMLARCGCPVLTVHMTGDWAAIYARFKARNESEARHLGHVVNDRYPPLAGGQTRGDTMPMEVFVEGMRARGMDEPPVDGSVIAVDTTDLARVDPEDTLRRVRAWIDGQNA